MKSRRFKELAILGVVLATIAVAALDKSPTSYPPVTLKMTQATGDELLWKVAELEHFQVVGVQPGALEESTYRQDYDFVDAQVEEVLTKTFCEWKLIADVLVVTPKTPTPAVPDACPMEYLLEEAPASVLIPILQQAYPRTLLIPHPTMNGFYARGTKDDLLDIKRHLAELDQNPIPPLPKRLRVHQVQWLDPIQLQSAIQGRYPQLEVKVQGKSVEVIGGLIEAGQALSFARQLDRRELEHPVSLTSLKQAPSTCHLDCPHIVTTVDCPESCHGPLQVLGLQNGDILPDYYNDPLRTKPEWWVKRDGKDYRIVLKIER